METFGNAYDDHSIKSKKLLDENTIQKVTSKKNYSDQLKDPRWQKKRLDIMNRDGFMCNMCKCNDKTLNVHHIQYIFGNRPWEYNNDNLITLCEECHNDIELTIKRFKREISLLNSPAMLECTKNIIEIMSSLNVHGMTRLHLIITTLYDDYVRNKVILERAVHLFNNTNIIK